MLALTVCGAGLAKRFRCRIRDGWTEPTNIFSVTSLPPGDRKSAVFVLAVAPVQEFEQEEDERLTPEIAEKASEHRILEARLKSMENKAARENDPEKRTELRMETKELARELAAHIVPERPQLWCDDVTPEKLAQLLAQQGGRMLQASAEGTAFEIAKGRYSETANFDVYLKGHAGDDLRVGRITREGGTVKQPALSVALAVQPDVILGLADQATMRGRGFLARWLYSIPTSLVGNRRIAPAPVSQAVLRDYQKLVINLFKLPGATDERGRPAPNWVCFSPPADQAMRSFERWLEPQLGQNGNLSSLAGWANKLAGAIARLAAILHLATSIVARTPWQVPISESTVLTTIRLGQEYLLPHAIAAFGLMGADARTEKAKTLLNWILRETKEGKQPEQFSRRDAHRALGRRIGRVDELDPVLELLVKHNYTRPKEMQWRPGSGRRESQLYEVNPLAYGQRGLPADDADRIDTINQEEHLTPDSVNSVNSVDGTAPSKPTFEGTRYMLISEPTELEAVAAALEETAEVGLDLETTGLDPRQDRIRLLSLSCETIDGGRFTYLVDCFAVDPGQLFPSLSAKQLVIHDADFDLGFLARLGFTSGAVVHDTRLLAQLLTAGTWQSNKLGACCESYLGKALDKTEQRSDWSGELSAEQLAYATRDVEVLVPLLRALEGKLSEYRLLEIAKIEQRCFPALTWMGNKGVAFDAVACQALAQKSESELQRLRADLDGKAPSVPGSFDGMSSWNWDSPVQVKETFRLLGFDLESTDDEALAAVEHPLADLLRQYRAVSKLVSSYGRKLLEHVASDGRIYPTWRQLGAPSSGRMSCSDPNLQQLPRGEYRRCIVAPPGRVLVKADYSQIELRIAAKISGDKALLDAYLQGEDLHVRTARNVLGIAEVTKKHRQLAKALNFGLLYGMGIRGFRRYAKSEYRLNLTEQEAGEYREAFFRTYPGLAAWHRRVRTRRATETRTLAGRRRLLDDKTPDTHRMNTPVQGTGADGLKVALALLWERRDRVPGAFPILAVHDEIVMETDEGEADKVAAWLKEAMVDAMAPFIEPVPVEVEIKTGHTWGMEE
jgi:DNA polymerase-1